MLLSNSPALELKDTSGLRAQTSACHKAQAEHNLLKPLSGLRDVYQDWVLARKACNKILAEVSLEDAAHTQELLHKKADMFTSLDSTFVIELAAMDALMGAGGLELVQAQLLKSLPAKETAMTLEHSMQLLTQMKDSLLFKYSGAEARSTVLAILEIVSGMKGGRPPKMEVMNGDPFLRKVQEALPHFVRCGEGQSELTGKEAIEAMMDELVKIDNPEDVTYEKLNTFHVFNWLLTEKQAECIKTLAKAVVANVGQQRKSGKVASEGDRRSLKRGKTFVAEPAEDEVLSLFG